MKMEGPSFLTALANWQPNSSATKTDLKATENMESQVTIGQKRASAMICNCIEYHNASCGNPPQIAWFLFSGLVPNGLPPSRLRSPSRLSKPLEAPSRAYEFEGFRLFFPPRRGRPSSFRSLRRLRKDERRKKKLCRLRMATS